MNPPPCLRLFPPTGVSTQRVNSYRRNVCLMFLIKTFLLTQNIKWADIKTCGLPRLRATKRSQHDFYSSLIIRPAVESLQHPGCAKINTLNALKDVFSVAFSSECTKSFYLFQTLGLFLAFVSVALFIMWHLWRDWGCWHWVKWQQMIGCGWWHTPNQFYLKCFIVLTFDLGFFFLDSEEGTDY